MRIPVPVVTIGGIRVEGHPSVDSLLDEAFRRHGILVAVNAEKTVKATARLRAIINANIGYCDGAGAVKAAHAKGAKGAIRIPGCELWLRVVERGLRDNRRFYLIGSTQNVVDATVAKLQKEYPGIDIAGWHNGFLQSDCERQKLIEAVRTAVPDVVFVAMGSPKQEYLMDEMARVHPKAVYQGLGGSFDLYVGTFKRAPETLRRAGMEWAWRFIAQPSRWRRLGPYMQFAWRLYTNRL